MDFGYPEVCSNCFACQLKVKPYYKQGGSFRLMLIGQDPTIRKNRENVKSVLMLDDPNSQLYRWLNGLFGSERFENITIYATNLVKCTLNKVPSESKEGGTKFLQNYFINCQHYLKKELENYNPTMVLTFGEPAHKWFSTLLTDQKVKPMKEAFTGDFESVSVGNKSFYYSPCLHIQTFRVAETYGDKIKSFKSGLHTMIDQSTAP